jgi:SAM-dependent methyltransferase/ribosomal protein S18 acetylase RimI-like enzyme
MNLFPAWTWRRALRRAAQVLRDEGALSLWYKVLGETVYRRLVLFERRLDGPAVDVMPSLPVVFGLLKETEVDEYVSLRSDSEPAEVRRRLFRKGGEQKCFTVRYEGRLVHVCWVATGRAWIEYLDREVVLAPDEAYLYDGFTAPGFRGHNISPARSSYAQRTLRQAGYQRLLATVMPENRRAIPPVERSGYQATGSLGFFRIGPWRRHFGRLDRRGLGRAQWDDVAWRMRAGQHYLDPFLGAVKRQAHLGLIERWGGVRSQGLVLKTDLFEEALGPDAFLTDLEGRLVVGMDVSPVVASQARERDADGRSAYVAADVRRLPFAAGSFRLIVSPSTLDHFVHPADLGCSLLEFARCLEPNGRLIVTLDNRQNILDPLLRLAARAGRVPYYLGRSYSVSELRAELEKAGFEVQETTAILHNPRLAATGAVALANRLRWQPFTHWVRCTFIAAQRLEQTRWRYLTGSFVAAQAIKRAD